MPSLLKRSQQLARQIGANLPLRTVLIVPFVVEIVVAVGLTGYLSFHNGQESVNKLAAQLRLELSDRIDQHLDSYLSTPRQLTQSLADGIHSGLIDQRNYRIMGQFFYQQVQLFDIGYINFGLASGDYVGAGLLADPNNPKEITVGERSAATGGVYVNYTTDAAGNRLQGTPDPTYDHREEAWYLDTLKAGKPNWSEIYVWDGDNAGQVISIAASQPIYDQNQRIMGAIGVDLILSNLSDFLNRLRVGSGRIMILERDGSLIASCGRNSRFKTVNGELKPLNILDSSDPLMQAAAKHLQANFGDFKRIQTSQQLEFTFKGQRQFIQVMPWQDEWGLDWLILLVVPESDFMEQININTQTTILLCILALAVAILVGLITARWITGPILRLSAASQKIAEGDRQQIVWVAGIKELKTLANVFNQMSREIQLSHQQLSDYSRSLESRVRERTQELEQEVRDRQMAEVELQLSLKEKTALLQEVHHRVKNNLQVISSLLRLQGRRTDDPQVQQILAESENRVMAMALVHQNLYQSSDFAQVSLEHYIRSLVSYLFSAFGIQPQQVQLHIQVDPKLTVPLDKAVPCGLIINELVINALKHGIQPPQPGNIWIRLSQNESQISLNIANDGSSLPENFSSNATSTMGLKLVNILVEQLNGILIIQRQPLTSFQITFNPGE